MSEKWTVKGKILVSHVLPELVEVFGPSGGVPGIKVKVSARSKILTGWGTWNSWGQLTTGADGSFTVSEYHGGDRRQFKVEILFDSEKLRIKEGDEDALVEFDSEGFPLDINFDLTEKDWHEVHNDKDGAAAGGRQAGVIDLGDIFVMPAVVKKHADLWILYNQVFDLVDGYGPAYSFQKKVFVKYPMKLGSISYTNPLNDNTYIDGDEFNSSTLLHELVHRWVYDHCSGEDGLAWQAVKHGTTHQARENRTYTAFHEGFAEWATYPILKAISGGKLRNFVDVYFYEHPDVPVARSYLRAALDPSEQNTANVDYTERGWHSCFNILTYPYLDRVDFNRELVAVNAEGQAETDEKAAFVSLFTSCSEMRLGYSFQQVLSIFLKYPGKGIPDYMGADDMNLRSFLDRAGAILPGFESEQVRQVKVYLNPSGEKNPCDLVTAAEEQGRVVSTG